MPRNQPSIEVRRTMRIRNQLGMHARAAVRFVRMAGRFESEIWVAKDGEQVNGKSIMGLLTLVAALGMEIEVIAQGPDAEAAITALAELVDSGFGEGVVPDPAAPVPQGQPGNRDA